jgi:hypothetical protein
MRNVEKVGDEAELERLVVAAAAGDPRAWHRLWCVLEPRRSSLSRRLLRSRRDDDARDTVVAVMAAFIACGGTSRPSA